MYGVELATYPDDQLNGVFGDIILVASLILKSPRKVKEGLVIDTISVV